MELCEGKQGDQAFLNCSGPSASFSLDLVNLLSSWLGEVNRVLSNWTQPVLKGYYQVSHWTMVAHMIDFITTFITVITSLVWFLLAKLVTIISLAVS